MIKKKLAAAVASVMVLSLFAGCTGSSTPKTTPAPAQPNTGQQAAAFSGYPMSIGSGKTISWYIGEGYTLNNAYATAAESPFHKGLAEELGVNIDWTYPPAGTDQKQNFNLLIASGSYPEIIFYSTIMENAERFMNEGVIRDLSNYIKDYSPSYYAWLQTNPAYDKAMKTDSGKYYGYGFFREDGGWNDTYMGPVIRQDWLEACGLKMPETIADWDATLKAFKEKYNKTFTTSWTDRFKLGGGICGAFGAYGGFEFRVYVDKEGKMQLGQSKQEWKNYMTKMNEWWKAGYIDQDILSTDNAAARTKALNGETGFAYTSMGQLSNWITDAEKEGKGAKWTGLQYPKGNDGTLSMVFGGYGIGGVVAAVTTACKDDKLELVMRALDYAYTPEGNLYWNYGKKGVSWDYDANGKPAYTALVTEDPGGINDAISKYGGSTWSGNCIQETLLLYLKNTPTSIAANDLWFYPNQDVTAYYTIPRGMTFTVEESNRVDEIAGAIRTYVEETAVKYMTGEESISTYDNFLSRLKTMGMDEMLEKYQAAYDRYKKR